MLDHLRHAVHILAKSPGLTVVAATTLALGIGANTAIFTVANALLLRPLPYADPERLALISAPPSDERDTGGLLSYPFFALLRDRNRSFSGVAASTFEIFNLSGRGDPEQVRSARVSWNFFQVLGIQPMLGRAFVPEEDRPGGKDVVIISHELWMRAFAGDRNVIGQTVTLDSRSLAVIGVLPPRFAFPLIGMKTDVWAPRVYDLSLVTPARVNAGGPYFDVIGRLRQGVSREQAQSELQALYHQYRRDYPGNYDATLDASMLVYNLQDQFVVNLRPTLVILSASVAFVLLIACANVASLLLARALGRKKEFAVRTAMGGSRGTLVAQLLIESALLAGAGGGLAILLGQAGIRFLSVLSQTTYPQIAAVRMDADTLVFTLAISLASGVLFGLAPALQLSKPDLNTILRNESRTSAGHRGTRRARSLLVVAQVALSTMLLVGAGLLLRSFIRLHSVNPGFDPKHLLTMEITLPPARYPHRPEMIAFYRDLIRRVQTVPGVEAAALSTALPAFPTHQTPALFEGQPAVVLGKRPIVHIQQFSPDYAQALRVPLVAGRTFTDHDDAEAPPVAMVNQTAVGRFWPDQNPLGKRIWVGSLAKPFEVVGVLGDVKNAGIGLAVNPEIFLPLAQLPWSLLYLSVRTEVPPANMTAFVRRELAGVDPDQPVARVMTGEELLDSASAQPRFTTSLVGLFSIVAFLLAVIGIYSVIAYSVAQRTQELGIRIALGATRGNILRLVIRSGVALTGAGILIGVAASLALTRFMASLLFQTSTTDLFTIAASAALFTAAAVLACYLPAHRATRIDPTDALRAE
jgi:putative ABC transport system permease protein